MPTRSNRLHDVVTSTRAIQSQDAAVSAKGTFEFSGVVDRSDDFDRIRIGLGESIADETEVSLVAGGDSLELLVKVPDGTVSLILCDPPYHSTKKGNIYGDRSFQEDEHFLEWIEKYATEWRRVLRDSGTLYVFCSAQMAARLEVMLSKHFRPINHITWTKPNEPGYDGWKGKMNKEALRTWYPHSERILVFEHGGYGSWEAYRRSPLGEYLLACRKLAGITAHDLTERIGAYGKVNHGGPSLIGRRAGTFQAGSSMLA